MLTVEERKLIENFITKKDEKVMRMEEAQAIVHMLFDVCKKLEVSNIYVR